MKRKHGSVVLSEPEKKEKKVFFKKCWLKNNFYSLAYAHD